MLIPSTCAESVNANQPWHEDLDFVAIIWRGNDRSDKGRWQNQVHCMWVCLSGMWFKCMCERGKKWQNNKRECLQWLIIESREGVRKTEQQMLKCKNLCHSFTSAVNYTAPVCCKIPKCALLLFFFFLKMVSLMKRNDRVKWAFE